jgi:hypothetical protein
MIAMISIFYHMLDELLSTSGSITILMAGYEFEWKDEVPRGKRIHTSVLGESGIYALFYIPDIWAL